MFRVLIRRFVSLIFVCGAFTPKQFHSLNLITSTLLSAHWANKNISGNAIKINTWILNNTLRITHAAYDHRSDLFIHFAFRWDYCSSHDDEKKKFVTMYSLSLLFLLFLTLMPYVSLTLFTFTERKMVFRRKLRRDTRNEFLFMQNINITNIHVFNFLTQQWRRERITWNSI